MRILIAPQELKGTLSAMEAAQAVCAAAQRIFPDAELDLAPIADGGSGTSQALLAARGGELQRTPARDPLGRWREAEWAILSDGTGAIDMAAASGLVLLRADERDPGVTTSAGTGDLILAALRKGCRRLIVGLGGSATNDGGAGAAQALGIRFRDGSGQPLPAGGLSLINLASIEMRDRVPELLNAELTLATDVTHPLLGPNGATRIFGLQKGASPQTIDLLELALGRFEEVVRIEVGRAEADLPGMGSAGGLAYGLSLLAGGRIEGGFALLDRELKLEDRVQHADLVLTAEGRFDVQTLGGKGPGALARLARKHGKTVVMLTGSADDQAVAAGLFDYVQTLPAAGNDPAAALGSGAETVLRSIREASQSN